jgi:hypothetical protein
MLHSEIHVYEAAKKMCVADPSERKAWSAIGIRRLIRDSGLSQKTVYKILAGDLVRCYILFSFRQALDTATLCRIEKT